MWIRLSEALPTFYCLMTTESRFILDLILRSAEEEFERDFQIKLRLFLDEAINRVTFNKIARQEYREHAVAHPYAGQYSNQNTNNSHEKRTGSGPSSREPRRAGPKIQGDIDESVKKRNPICDSPSWILEKGEINEGPRLQEALQWEELTEFKSQMSCITNPVSREEQLRQLSKLEHQIAEALSYASSKVLEEQIENQLGISMRGVKREANRILVEVEGSLLRFKAEVYAKTWRGVKDVLAQCQHVTSLQDV